MSSSKFSLLQSVYFLLIILTFQSCADTDKPGTYKNSAIKSSKREDFHKLNDQLFEALKANQPEVAKNFMSKDLMDDNSVNRTVELISLRTKGGKYSLLDEYYSKDEKEPSGLIFNADATGEDAYTIDYRQADTKENYAALMVVPKNAQEQWLITAIYGKYNYGWKLNKLDLGAYKINGKTAPEQFKLAKEKYKKSYWIDAVNAMSSAEQCFRPSTSWKYASENAMNKFYYKVVQEVNGKYTFPFTINQLQTKPKIFRIFTQVIPDEGTFPMIYYVSSISLKDTLALKKENEQLKKVIGKVLPGIDQDKKYVLYSAFNGFPDGRKVTQHYDLPYKK